jgi:hypothetical protein
MQILERIKDSVESPRSPFFHLERADLLLQQAARPRFEGRRSGSAMLIGAVYFAVAFFENVVELFADGTGARTKEQSEVRDLFLARVPHLELLEDIRVQDFHRNPVPIPVPGLLSIGPTKWKVSGHGSYAGVTFEPDAGKVTPHSHGNASVKQNRPLSISGYKIANGSGAPVDIRVAIRQYISAAYALLKES